MNMFLLRVQHLQDKWFLQYLWGIKLLFNHTNAAVLYVLQYLWELKPLVYALIPQKFVQFYSTWGWNYLTTGRIPSKCFTVPMRNWNTVDGHLTKVCFYSTYEIETFKNFLNLCDIFVSIVLWDETPFDYTCQAVIVGFYSTYEELKLIHSTIAHVIWAMFLQYLWGIETGEYIRSNCSTIYSFYSTYEELKLNS